MWDLFALNYTGPAFELLGPAHIGVLATIVALNLALLWARRTSERVRELIRRILGITIWTAEASWQIWSIAVGNWRPQVMLPLNLCSILIWLSGWMLLRRNYRIYEFAYFLGIGGALQYLATPDLGIYGFPHFRFIQAYTSHGLLLTAPIFMTVVEGFRPTWESFKRVLIGANLYMIPIYFINVLTGSNFLMLNAKPATASLLDLFPAWPYYIVFMELIGVITCLLLYLPFVIADSRAARHLSRA